MYFIMSSTINTDKQAPHATVRRLLPKKASKIATASPAIAEKILLVAYKIVHRDVSINTIKNYVYNYDSSPHC